MKKSIIASALATLTVMAGVAVDSLRPKQVQAETNTSFYCDENGRNPVTRVRTSEGNVPVVIWETFFFPPPYTPLVRCRQVSGRFRRFQAEGRLDFMTTGWINNQPVICVTNEFGSPCDDPKNLLMTLRPDDDPDEILEGLLDVRDFNSAPVKHYCPQAVYKSNGRTYIYVDELLERKKLIAAGDCRP